MNLRKLTERVYYYPHDPSVDRPVLGYILDDNFPFMIDAGNSAKHVHDYNCALAEKGFKKPKYCVITHWHWDHTFGMHALDAETIAHNNTNKELERMAAWKWDDEAMRKRLISTEEIPFADEHIRAEYSNTEEIKIIPAAITFDKRLVINCGNITCECMHLPSAHSDDSIVIYIPEEKTIFIGDIYNDDFYNNRYRDLEKTKGLYEELSKIDFDIVIAGHSEPSKKNDILNFLHSFF